MDSMGRIAMGVENDDCDNGKDRLDVDWDGSPVNHTCYTPKDPLPVSEDVEALITCDSFPSDYMV